MSCDKPTVWGFSTLEEKYSEIKTKIKVSEVEFLPVLPHRVHCTSIYKAGGLVNFL